MLHLAYRVVSLGALLFLSQIAFAQNADWRSFMTGPDANLFRARAAFRAEAADRGTLRIEGWKQFQRWDEYYHTRVDAQGNLPDQSERLRVARKEWLNYLTKGSVDESNWTEVGPIDKPANGTTQPNGNGRLNCVAFHPTDPNTFFVGSPSGGMFETNDGGSSWTKRVDGAVRLGISSIVIHPTQPNIMYIGTGDRDGGDAPGYGVWRSLDGGVSMAPYHNGMPDVTVHEILMHPNDPDIMIAATDDYSVYRTTDGGANWFESYVGAEFTDLAMHPTNPDILYAGAREYGTPGSSLVYRSTDNGINWDPVDTDPFTGISTFGTSRATVAVSPDDPDVVYALIGGWYTAADFGGLYRSDDGGLTWTLRSDSPNISGGDENGTDTRSQSWYDHVLVVDPNDADNLFFGAINIWNSTDGGYSWTASTHWVGNQFYPQNYSSPSVHADHHALEFHPLTGDLYSGNDGGLHVTADGGLTWTEKSNGLSIAQVYKLGVSQNEQDLVINGYQDNGTSMYYPGAGGWTTEIGGDGFECAIDPTTDQYVYGSLYYGEIRRSSNYGTTFFRISGNGIGGINEWGAFSAPFTLDPTDPETIYLGMQNVWRTDNARGSSPSWRKISNWPTTTTVHDIAVSPANPDNMMVSRDNKEFYRTANGQSANPTWVSTGANLPGDAFVKDITYHPTEPNTAYVAVDSYVYVTADNGDTWNHVSNTLPGGLSANCIVLDTTSSVNSMYVGMDVGVYYYDDNQATWTMFRTGLPNVEVTDLEIHYGNSGSTNVLYGSTYGAGMWKSPTQTVMPSAPVAEFSFSGDPICADEAFMLTDRSTFNPTGWSWTFNPAPLAFANGTDASSQNPEPIFPGEGNYDVTLTVTNAQGSDQITKTVPLSYFTEILLPVATDFEVSSPDFTIGNPDGSYTWEDYFGASSDSDGDWSLSVNNYDYDGVGEEDYYTSDLIDASSEVELELSFFVAYAPYDEDYSDGLRVEVNPGCGGGWITVYDKSGLDLGTTGGYEQGRFEPTFEQWREEVIDLSAYAGDRLQVRFVNINAWGNLLYLDNITIEAGNRLLPIRLAGFTGDHVPKVGNELTWTMAEEEPGLTFTVERFDERFGVWRPVGQSVSADGGLQYGLTDAYPEFGVNLYRLGLYQYGTFFQYSPVVHISMDRALSRVTASPNPTSGILNVRTESESDGIESMQLIDATGRVIQQRTVTIRAGAQQHTMDMQTLPTGLYYLRVGEHAQRIVRE